MNGGDQVLFRHPAVREELLNGNVQRHGIFAHNLEPRNSRKWHPVGGFSAAIESEMFYKGFTPIIPMT
jgi:hypothetical protein